MSRRVGTMSSGGGLIRPSHCVIVILFLFLFGCITSPPAKKEQIQMTTVTVPSIQSIDDTTAKIEINAAGFSINEKNKHDANGFVIVTYDFFAHITGATNFSCVISDLSGDILFSADDKRISKNKIELSFDSLLYHPAIHYSLSLHSKWG